MTLRTRLMLAFAAVVLVPLVLLAVGMRQEMNETLSAEYAERLENALAVIREDLRREAASIDERLASVTQALVKDTRFRAGAVAGVEFERVYVLDYAESAMRIAGLSMLQIHDEAGRIISSGHFRNDHGRLEPGLVPALQRAHGVPLLRVRAAEEDFLAIARTAPFRLGDRAFTAVGGVAVDGAFLRRLARDERVVVTLTLPGGTLTSEATAATNAGGDDPAGNEDAHVAGIPLPLVLPGAPRVDVVDATLQVRQSRAALAALLRRVDRWFLLTAAGTGAAALLLAAWVSSRISRPIAALADKAALLDLDRLDVQFEGGADEVGTLSRVLGDLADRLRSGTVRIRDAERRATVGDLARQINHDIKNGLIPIRNVVRHLSQVARDDPAAVATVLTERRQTLDSSISYLETLATNYERLSARPSRRACDLNALILDVVRGAHGHEHVDLHTALSPDLPRVHGDPVALRRILENLVSNAIDSLERRKGRVTVSTGRMADDGQPDGVRMTVTDTGRGMTREESAKIFNDFYTTKERGTGLGLSIVRRLVVDMEGSLRVESEPGTGTRMIVDLPAAPPES